MRLKALKLAGFKSFVDSTVIPLPSERVCVVGPNGCGKSNIIDAVKWVMGESSAKSLRGESMADVIFNGSSQRKPLGQASVELVFDNSLGRLGGAYGAYQEIAIRRVVTRDGDSAYYLNNTRVRRRDIIDIFLGTGAGARGYSIISQGSISQIIEAKPDDLRAIFEEAAGISKYKERKRETVSNIQHTRDNLLRVSDLREELTKQQSKLARQAQSAKQYQALKLDEKKLRGEILTLKWQELKNEISHQDLKIEKNHTIKLSHEAQALSIQNQLITAKVQMQEKQSFLEDLQQALFKTSTEMATLEKDIAVSQQEKLHLTESITTLNIEIAQLSQQVLDDTHLEQQLESQLQDLSEEKARAELIKQNLESELTLMEASYKTSKLEWEMAQQQYFNEKQNLSELNLKQKYLTEALQKISIQYEKTQQLISSINIDSVDQEYQQALTSYNQLKTANEVQKEIFDQYKKEHQNKSIELDELEKNIRENEKNCINLERECAQHEAEQKAYLSQLDDGDANNTKFKRLLECLQVEPRWQTMVEWVLDTYLGTYMLESWDYSSVESFLNKKGIYSSWLDNITKNSRLPYPRLSEKVTGPLPAVAYFLDNIYLANDWDEALKIQNTLEPGETVLTAEGHWLGYKYIRQYHIKDKTYSLLEGQQSINRLKESMQQCYQTRENYLSHQKNLIDEIDKLKLLTRNFEQELTLTSSNLLKADSSMQHALQRSKLLKEQLEQTQTKLDDLTQEQEATLCAQIENNNLLEQTSNRYEVQQLKIESLILNKETHEKNFDTSRNVVQEAREKLINFTHQVNQNMTKLENIRNNIARNSDKLENNKIKLSELETKLEKLNQTTDDRSPKLEALAQLHHTQENTLLIHRDEFVTIQQGYEKCSSQEKNMLSIIKDIEATQSSLLLEKQSLIGRVSALEEQAAEQAINLPLIKASLPESLTLQYAESKLTDLILKIQKLGAINLAAIEEYEETSSRKQILDSQYDDLVKALETLELAMASMDKETRERLRNTFEDVNLKFKQLFPRLFGGGQAMLTLTSEDILEAGVHIMAQPPGKKNASIFLLSGGEKALTAIALVFAIFQLNPSPFCLLDEVDAPLDDVNVGRFCDIVREMSQYVQFLVISHNKVTMEMASQLIGVTMREPGVSKVVAVDVEQALTMCDS